MRQIQRRTFLAAVLAGAWLWAVPARAQNAPSSLSGGSIGSIYGNAGVNPYMNPLLTNGAYNRNDTLLYLYAAQQAPGGMLAPRPISGMGPAAKPSRTPGGAVDTSWTVMTPGGGAAKYFGRTTVAETGGSKRYYHRSDHYFGRNGR